jgi:hypothetical protein
MECKWFAKPYRRNKIILKSKLHSYTPNRRNTNFPTKNYFSTPRYKLHYTNHPNGTAHGGTATLMKEKIEHYERLRYEEDPIQATAIKVKGFPYE